MLIQDVRPKSLLERSYDDIKQLTDKLVGTKPNKIVVRSRPLSDKCYQCGRRTTYAAEFAVCEQCQSKADNEE